MKTSYEIAKNFHDQFIAKGKKNGSRITDKQSDWLRGVYLKEKKNTAQKNALLIFKPDTAKEYYRLNHDNSLYLVIEE